MKGRWLGSKVAGRCGWLPIGGASPVVIGADANTAKGVALRWPGFAQSVQATTSYGPGEVAIASGDGLLPPCAVPVEPELAGVAVVSPGSGLPRGTK